MTQILNVASRVGVVQVCDRLVSTDGKPWMRLSSDFDRMASRIRSDRRSFRKFATSRLVTPSTSAPTACPLLSIRYRHSVWTFGFSEKGTRCASAEWNHRSQFQAPSPRGS